MCAGAGGKRKFQKLPQGLGRFWKVWEFREVLGVPVDGHGAGCKHRFRRVPDTSGRFWDVCKATWFRKVPEGSGRLGCRARGTLQAQVPPTSFRSSGSSSRQRSGRLGSWYAGSGSSSGRILSFRKSNRGDYFLSGFEMDLLQVTAVWFWMVQRRCSETWCMDELDSLRFWKAVVDREREVPEGLAAARLTAGEASSRFRRDSGSVSAKLWT